MDTLPRGASEWAMTALVVVLVFYGVFPNGNVSPPSPPPPPPSLSSIDSSGNVGGDTAAVTGHHPGSLVPLSNAPVPKSSHDVIAAIKARRQNKIGLVFQLQNCVVFLLHIADLVPPLLCCALGMLGVPSCGPLIRIVC